MTKGIDSYIHYILITVHATTLWMIETHLTSTVKGQPDTHQQMQIDNYCKLGDSKEGIFVI